jgi:hypothetical protein
VAALIASFSLPSYALILARSWILRVYGFVMPDFGKYRYLSPYAGQYSCGTVTCMLLVASELC